MPTFLERFEVFLSGHQRKTIVDYMAVLRNFEAWALAKTNQEQLNGELLTSPRLEAYLKELAKQGRTPRTQQKVLAILKLFCRWAADEGWLKGNPASQIESPAVETVSHELTSDQRRILKRLVTQQNSPRLAAIFALSYWTGLRGSEVVSLRLKLCEIDQRTGQITLLENDKGDKVRTLDLHSKTRKALYTYLYETPRTDSESRDEESLYVFTSQRAAWLRRNGQPDHLSVRGLEYLWTQAKAQASVSEWEKIQAVRFHDLRHDFVHRASVAGWSMEEIAVYAGYQLPEGIPTILSTLNYTLPGQEPLKARLQKLKG